MSARTSAWPRSSGTGTGGELKFFIDDDVELPTIAGTGLEDYVGGAWAFQDRLGAVPKPEPITFSSMYMGYHQRIVTDRTRVSPYAVQMPPAHGMYRWHLQTRSGLRPS